MTESSSEIRIEWEWLPAAGVKAPELQATWARLEIYIRNKCLTLVEDQESKSSRRGIYCSLYPLAEWIAYNWWFLQADSRPAAASDRLVARESPLPLKHRHYQHHNLRAAGDGFLWPNLLIVPRGETTEFTWLADSAVTSDLPIQFLSSGHHAIRKARVVTKLADFVESVLARLHEAEVKRTPLEDEWAAIQTADDAEAAYCIASARLGLDPYAEAAAYADAIVLAAESLPDDLLNDFLDVVDPEKIAVDLEWINAARADIETLTAPTGAPITTLRQAPRDRQQWSTSTLRPWEIGWEQARIIRASAGLGAHEVFDIEARVSNTTRTSADRGLQAYGRSGVDGFPSVVLSRQSTENTKRFALARAAWHVLWRDSPDFLVTAAYNDRQKSERAFAAELLAPASGIAELLDDATTAGLDEIEEIARRFNVSPMIVQHQIENQLLSAW